MDVKDIFLTPIYLIFIYIGAFIIKKRIRNKTIRRYFLPALTVKIIGAVTLGLIYTFYYRGGDTFNYYHDSKIIWEAFLDSPFKALAIIFSDHSYDPEIQSYTRRIYFYVDPNSFHVVRTAGFFGLFTFHTYSLIAIFFALTCFSGMWALYKVFYDLYPKLHRQLAIAIFFIPSVFFWGLWELHNNTEQYRGKGRAVAGLVLGGTYVIVLLVYISLALLLAVLIFGI